MANARDCKSLRYRFNSGAPLHKYSFSAEENELLKGILFGALLLGSMVPAHAADTNDKDCISLKDASEKAEEAAKILGGKFKLFENQDAVNLIRVWNEHINGVDPAVGESVGVVASPTVAGGEVFFVHEGKTCSIVIVRSQLIALWMGEALKGDDI